MRIRWKTASALVTVLLLCAGESGLLRAAQLDAEVLLVPAPDFKIPVTIAAEERADLQELRLLMSDDEGKTWKQVAVDSCPKEFVVHVPKDGLYWFSVQSVKKDGKATPKDLGDLQPLVKIRVKKEGVKQKPADRPAEFLPIPPLPPTEEMEGEYRCALAAAIHQFVESGDLRLLRATLTMNPKLVDAKPNETYHQGRKPDWEDDYTPLHRAAARGNAEIVAFLLDRGADVNHIAGAGWSPLHLAAKNGHLAVVKLLVQSGAKIDAKTAALPERAAPCGSEGEPLFMLAAVPSRTALQLAQQNKHADVVEYLKSAGK